MSDPPVLPRRFRSVDPELNAITYEIIGAAIEVQRVLGPGLLEKPYEAALAHELTLRGLDVRRQVKLAATYKGLAIEDAYLLDLEVAARVAVELKATAALAGEHEAQLATYLVFGGYDVGLLINFRQSPLVSGIRRVASPSLLDERCAPVAASVPSVDSVESVGRSCGPTDDRAAPTSGLAGPRTRSAGG